MTSGKWRSVSASTWVLGYSKQGCWGYISGVEIIFGHQTWPNVFATSLVINFPNFKLCSVTLCTRKWKLFSSFLGLVVVYQRSKNKEPKRYWQKKPVPCNITINVCALFSAGCYLLFVVIPGNHTMLDFQS